MPLCYIGYIGYSIKYGVLITRQSTKSGEPIAGVPIAQQSTKSYQGGLVVTKRKTTLWFNILFSDTHPFIVMALRMVMSHYTFVF